MARETADGDDAQIPTTDTGAADYETMAVDLGLENVSRRHPAFIADETGEVTAILDVDTAAGTATLVDAHALGHRDTRDVSLEMLWRDWRYDSLNFRRRRFLRTDDVAVPRGELAQVVTAVLEADDMDDVQGAAGALASELPEEDLD